MVSSAAIRSGSTASTTSCVVMVVLTRPNTCRVCESGVLSPIFMFGPESWNPHRDIRRMIHVHHEHVSQSTFARFAVAMPLLGSICPDGGMTE
jgi:hypothetical protein